MRTILQSITAVCVATLLATAHAGGFYLGGGLGKANSPVGVGNATTGYITKNKWVTAGKIFAGYQFSDYLGSELSYFQTSGLTAGRDGSGGQVKMYALALTAVGFIPINQQFKLGADAGIYHDALKLNALSGAASYPDNINHNPNETTGFTYGVFGEYMFMQNAYLRLGYDQLVGRAKGTAMRLSPKFYTLSLAINLGNGDGDSSGDTIQ